MFVPKTVQSIHKILLMNKDIHKEKCPKKQNNNNANCPRFTESSLKLLNSNKIATCKNSHTVHTNKFFTGLTKKIILVAVTILAVLKTKVTAIHENNDVFNESSKGFLYRVDSLFSRKANSNAKDMQELQETGKFEQQQQQVERNKLDKKKEFRRKINSRLIRIETQYAKGNTQEKSLQREQQQQQQQHTSPLYTPVHHVPPQVLQYLNNYPQQLEVRQQELEQLRQKENEQEDKQDLMQLNEDF
eukprot:Pgem_evm1s7863